MTKGEQPKTLTTPGQVFAHFKQLPEMQEFIRACYYDDVQEAAGRFCCSSEFAEVKSYVAKWGKGPPGLVLDLGGGNGMGSLAWEMNGYRTILLEPDPDTLVGYGAILPLITQGRTAVRVCAAVAESISFADAVFDIVYIRQVLHHIPDLGKVAAEVHRILKPGGLCMATREHVISKREDLDRFRAAHIIHQYTGGENAYPAEEYVRALRHAGFKLVTVRRRWESSINYYPITGDQLTDILVQHVQGFFGERVARTLVRVKPFHRLLSRLLAGRDDEPGRMYSFFAVK